MTDEETEAQSNEMTGLKWHRWQNFSTMEEAKALESQGKYQRPRENFIPFLVTLGKYAIISSCYFLLQSQGTVLSLAVLRFCSVNYCFQTGG